MTNAKTDTSLSTTLILLTFIVLKLTHVINWSWWWILAPAWIPVSLIIVAILVYFVYKMLSK